MPELQRLRADHAPALLAFELANRAYFAASVSDLGAYYVLVGEDGSALGRFNLYRIADGTAELGYRVAEHVAGRGVATANVQELCRLAAKEHGLRMLRAETNHENVASQKVLQRAGFAPVGPASPGGRPGIGYERDLTASP
jgi:ribosomal-protein-alanine N-acetyltransferase